ncbi:MAG: alkaline phosphatase family protein [Ferruginibacter sp.]
MKKVLIFLSFILMFAISTAQQLTKKLVILTLDGYRWKELFRGADSSKLFGKEFTSQDSAWKNRKHWSENSQTRREKLMPFFWETIVNKGQVYGNRDLGNYVDVKNPYWYSYPGYNEIFTGYADSLIHSNDYPDNPHRNVLEYINMQRGYKNKVVVFTSWDAFPRILNEKRSGLLINSGFSNLKGKLNQSQKEINKQQYYFPQIFDTSERPDALTYSLAKAYLMHNHPKVVYLGFNDTDAFAHQGKYDFYLDAAHYIDAMISDLWDYLQSDGFYKDQTTLFITVDHGRGEGDEWKHHNSKIKFSNETWFAALGPDTKPLGEIKTSGQIFQNQYAKTIAALLGFNFSSVNPVGEEIKSILKYK